MSDMKEGEIGVLFHGTGDIFSLTNALKSDGKLFDLVDEYLNKQDQLLVTICGTEPEP